MSHLSINTTHAVVAASIAGALFASTAAFAEPLAYAPSLAADSAFDQVLRQEVESRQPASEVPAHLRRRVVAYQTREVPGTIIIDTPNTQLYYVLGGGRAIRYGIGVGREGFTWSGVQTVARMAEWPDWIRRRKCCSVNPIYRDSWPAVRAIRWAPAPCISVAHLSHSRHRRTGNDRHASLKWLHPHAERGRDRSLWPGQPRYQGRSPAGQAARRPPDCVEPPVNSGSQAGLGRRQHCPVVRTLLRS